VNEEQLYRWLMITTATLAALCGLGAVSLIVLCAMSFSLGVLLCAVLMAAGAVSCGYATLFFSQKTTVPKVFNNQDEKEVLTNRQRRELRRKRGEVVMERALIEVEHEHQNIVHNLQNEANDPSLPPYQTRWSNGANVLPAPRKRKQDDEEEAWER
jgi:membrane protein implicated in regulation of membrane protease activity